jgi:dihydroorotase
MVDPANSIDAVQDLFIDQGHVVAIGNDPGNFSPDSEIDATGQYVFPGLVDLCARLREPGEEYKATILSESTAAASAGITTMICPPDTFPIIDTPAMAHMIQDRAEDAGFCSVHPLGALTTGLKGERLTDMAMLMDAGCVGVSNALEAVENSLVMRRAMQYASTFDIRVFLTPKDPWLQGNGVVHEGVVSTWLGLPAIPEAAETVGVARDLALIETSGASAHFQLISCRRSVFKIAEARQRDVPVTASVSIHHLLCSEENIGAFDTQYKVMPPLRTIKDRDGLIQGVIDGQIAAICSDHQPHGADAKLAPFSEAATGIAGIDTLLSLTYSLVMNGSMDLQTAVSALTANPADIAGLDRGHLSIGACADLCIFDGSREWILDESTMQSRGRNSPFMGQPLYGKVTSTIRNGKIVYQEN